MSNCYFVLQHKQLRGTEDASKIKSELVVVNQIIEESDEAAQAAFVAWIDTINGMSEYFLVKNLGTAQKEIEMKIPFKAA